MSTIVRLPGLIDAHVHLRSPGGEHKEDWRSGSCAALAGGFTHVLAMPNTRPPLVTVERWQAARAMAHRQALCEVDVMAGASPEHLDELDELGRSAVALKVYMDETYGPLRMTALHDLQAAFQRWPASKPIAVHAEQTSVAAAIGLAAALQRPVHICHVSRCAEIKFIAAAKNRGLPVTCEVTPHHLFLTDADAVSLGPLGDMRPTLGTAHDRDALWQALGTVIDCIATDHAPHTLAEKRSGTPPPGVPGLETALPLMLDAVQRGRLTLARLVDLLHHQPRRIYGLREQPETWTEVDLAAQQTIGDGGFYTKCGWSPFTGTRVTGRVLRVFLRGRLLVEEGRVLMTDHDSAQQEADNGL